MQNAGQSHTVGKAESGKQKVEIGAQAAQGHPGANAEGRPAFAALRRGEWTQTLGSGEATSMRPQCDINAC
jgi:hypothetical protein